MRRTEAVKRGIGTLAGLGTIAARAAIGGLAAVAAAALAVPAAAQQTQQYVPGIWVDPDGCEHWVMDDGAEGFMTPHRRADGTPVCHRTEMCGVMPSDQFFATNGTSVDGENAARLRSFFQNTEASGFLIYGHTDERASEEYNMRLSTSRANAVAQVAQSVGANVVDVRGFGERMPRAAGSGEAVWRQNRRVEIYCLR